MLGLQLGQARINARCIDMLMVSWMTEWLDQDILVLVLLPSLIEMCSCRLTLLQSR